jgi:SAM-dependent methyltransferase
MKILELGCGKRKGCGCPYTGEIIGMDIDPNSQADVIHDCEKFPYPFKDNEFDAVFMQHSLEHFQDTVAVMKEVWRITKPNGRVYIVVPYGASAWSLQNVMHKKFFNIDSLDIFTKKEFFGKPLFKILKKEFKYIFKGDPKHQSWKGKLLRKVMIPIDWLINLNHYLYEKIGRYYIGDADEIHWELEVIK